MGTRLSGSSSSSGSAGQPVSIDDWRLEIDALDDEILLRLNERASYAVEIGRLKRAQNVETYTPAREDEVLKRVIAANRGPLSADAIRRLFERIIDESRSIERTVC